MKSKSFPLSFEEMELFVTAAEIMGDTIHSQSTIESLLKHHILGRSKPFDTIKTIVEKKLNLRVLDIFNPAKNGGHFTTRGLEIANDLRSHLKSLESSLLNIANVKNWVTIGATNAVATFLLPEVLGNVNALEIGSSNGANRDRNPQSNSPNLDIREGEAWELVQKLEQRQIDFAIGPSYRPSNEIPLCEWTRVLVYPLAADRYSRFRNIGDLVPGSTDAKNILTFLAEATVFLPYLNVMPEVEDWLPRPTGKGQRIRLQQAAVRRYWVRRGLGVGIVYDERFTDEKDEIGTIDLTHVTGGSKTNLQFYLHSRQKKLLENLLQGTAIPRADLNVAGRFNENWFMLLRKKIADVEEALRPCTDKMSRDAIELLVSIWAYCNL